MFSISSLHLSVELIYIVVLVSGVQLSDSHTHTHKHTHNIAISKEPTYDHPSLKIPSFLVQNPLKPCSLSPGLYKVDLVLSTLDRQHLIKLNAFLFLSILHVLGLVFIKLESSAKDLL